MDEQIVGRGGGGRERGGGGNLILYSRRSMNW